MPETPSDEDILNVFRERHPEEKTLTTADLKDEFSVGIRTAQNYVDDLHDKGRLVLESEGKPNHWRLADEEPREPVYREELAKAKRWGNQAVNAGRAFMLVAIAVLAAAGLITSNHVFAQALNIYIPLLDASAVNTAVLVGIAGSVLFGFGGVALLFGVALPKAAEWYIEERAPE